MPSRSNNLVLLTPAVLPKTVLLEYLDRNGLGYASPSIRLLSPSPEKKKKGATVSISRVWHTGGVNKLSHGLKRERELSPQHVT